MKCIALFAALMFAAAACVDAPAPSPRALGATTGAVSSPAEDEAAPTSDPGVLEEDPFFCTTGVRDCAGKFINSACRVGPSGPDGFCYVQFSNPNWCNCGDGSDA
jgi:hypothetical protein